MYKTRSNDTDSHRSQKSFSKANWIILLFKFHFENVLRSRVYVALHFKRYMERANESAKEWEK